MPWSSPNVLQLTVAFTLDKWEHDELIRTHTFILVFVLKLTFKLVSLSLTLPFELSFSIALALRKPWALIDAQLFIFR